MKKFNYTKWLVEHKHGKTINEEYTAEDQWDDFDRSEKAGVLDDLGKDGNTVLHNFIGYEEVLDDVMNGDKEAFDAAILGTPLSEMKYDNPFDKEEEDPKKPFGAPGLEEEYNANKIKDSLKNLAKEKDLPGFGPTTTVDGDVRSDLVGIILPSLEKANAPEELIKNLEILSNKYNTDQGVSLAQQPDEVKNAITYLTGDEAQKSVDQIGDVSGGHTAALKKGADTVGGSTEKIYTATAFPDGLKDSDFYKKAVEDGWKFIPKNSLTSDQEKIAKSLPTKSDGTSLKETETETDKEEEEEKRYTLKPQDPKKMKDYGLGKRIPGAGFAKRGKDISTKWEKQFSENKKKSLKEAASQLGYLKEEYNMDLMRYHGGDRDKAAIDAYEKEYKKTEVSEVDGIEGGIKDINIWFNTSGGFYRTVIDGEKRVKGWDSWRDAQESLSKLLGREIHLRNMDEKELETAATDLSKQGIKLTWDDSMDVG